MSTPGPTQLTGILATVPSSSGPWRRVLPRMPCTAQEKNLCFLSFLGPIGKFFS